MLAHIDSQSIWQLDLFASVVIQNNLSLITFIMEHQGKLWKEHISFWQPGVLTLSLHRTAAIPVSL